MKKQKKTIEGQPILAPLSKRARHELSKYNATKYRAPLYEFGTVVTQGKISSGEEVVYEVEFLSDKKTLSNSRMLWMRDVNTKRLLTLAQDVFIEGHPKNPNFALISMKSPDGRFEFMASISRDYGFDHIFAISDHKEEVSYTADKDADVKWRFFEELDVDLRIALGEDTFNEAVGELQRIALERFPIDKNLASDALDNQGHEVPLGPFIKLLKEQSSKILDSPKDFFESMDYLQVELQAIYGNSTVADAIICSFLDQVDDLFVGDGKPKMVEMKMDLYREKMTQALEKYYGIEETLKMMSIEELRDATREKDN